MGDPEKYAKFFKNYSYYIKAGLLEDQQLTNGRHKDQIVKLLRFECSQEEKGKLVSLQEYVDSCKEEQKNIYYTYATSRDVAMASPFIETFNARRGPVLIFTDEIDEFVANGISDFKGKKLVSLDSTDTDFEMDLDKDDAPSAETPDSEQRELSTDDQNALETFLKQELGDKVSKITFTTRLTDSPAIVTSQLSPHLRKMMKSMMQGQDSPNQAMPVTLEVNPKHHLITTLAMVRETNLAVARVSAQQIYDTAMIAAGMIEEPKVLLPRMRRLHRRAQRPRTRRPLRLRPRLRTNSRRAVSSRWRRSSRALHSGAAPGTATACSTKRLLFFSAAGNSTAEQQCSHSSHNLSIEQSSQFLHPYRRFYIQTFSNAVA